MAAPEASAAQRATLVTGGAQGIGQGIVDALLAEGGRALAFDNDPEAGRELLADRAEAADDGRLVFVAGDVSDEDAVAGAVAAARDAFGILTGLVHNAGIGEWTPLERLELGAWRRVIDTNLTGYLLCAKHAAPQLRAAGGAIVAIASTRALMSEPDSEAYAASKGGIVALTHALAVSLGPEVRANAISPGWIEVRDRKKRSEREAPELREIDHAQHPAGRVGRPEDVAAMAAYLLSERAGFITGQNVVIDGGMTRKMIYRP